MVGIEVSMAIDMATDSHTTTAMVIDTVVLDTHTTDLIMDMDTVLDTQTLTTGK